MDSEGLFARFDLVLELFNTSWLMSSGWMGFVEFCSGCEARDEN